MEDYLQDHMGSISHTLADPKWAFLILSTSIMLALALVTDWIIGDMRWLFNHLAHPVVLMGKLISFLDKKLNREGRSSTNRRVRGVVASCFVIGLSIMAGFGLEEAALNIPYFWVFNIWLTAVLLAGRSLYSHVGAVAKGFQKSGTEGGRKAVSHIVGRDPKTLDKHAIVRASIESIAENFADGVVAPAFWFLIFGLPGILGYKAINTLDSMIGYRTKRHQDFGMFAAKLDDAVNFIPARISGVLIIIAAFFYPSSNPFRALKIMMEDAKKHASPNAGWPEGAMAGAFNWALGGPRKYPGGVTEAVWIGQGKARLEPEHIGQSQDLYAIANGVQLVIILILMLSNT